MQMWVHRRCYNSKPNANSFLDHPLCCPMEIPQEYTKLSVFAISGQTIHSHRLAEFQSLNAEVAPWGSLGHAENPWQTEEASPALLIPTAERQHSHKNRPTTNKSRLKRRFLNKGWVKSARSDSFPPCYFISNQNSLSPPCHIIYNN